ncbi:MAG: CRISPR-associated endonuclease Cas2 [Myxococcales bacterium]|nr:CRISPR-associated endonuclease Cas2 [Myxococcales bacterium]
MRTAYLVTYDITDPKRLRRVYNLMRGYGDHLQLSVFRCELSAAERVQFEGLLRAEIHHDEDQVLFARLGPADGRGRRALHTLGRAYTHPERHAIVV